MDLGHKETDKILERLEKEMIEIYGDTYKNIIDNNEKALLKLLALKDVNKFLYIKKDKKKLEIVLKSIIEEINKTNNKALDKINETMIEIYELNNQYTIYDLLKQTGFLLSIAFLTKEMIKKILNKGENIFKVMAIDNIKDKNIINRRLKRVILESISNGDSIEEMSKKIQKVINKNLNDCIRIARTETTRIENKARYDAFKKAEAEGIKLKKQWISTLDTRTRRSHQILMGEIKPLDEPFSNGLQYPCDPNGRIEEVANCRCTMVSNIEGVPLTEKEKELNERLRKKTFERFRSEWNEG